MGLLFRDACQRRIVQKANVLMQRCADFAVACILNAVPFAIENPEKSLMWETVQMRYVASLSNVKRTRYDFCQFGEAYHKATRTLSWGYQSIGERARTCSGRGGLPKPPALLSTICYGGVITFNCYYPSPRVAGI